MEFACHVLVCVRDVWPVRREGRGGKDWRRRGVGCEGRTGEGGGEGGKGQTPSLGDDGLV